MLKDCFRLVQCDIEVVPVENIGHIPSVLQGHCDGSAALYAKIGFAPPWISYVLLFENQPVGCGAFVGAPKEGRVEIAYFTLPENEGRGFATETARGLVKIAQMNEPNLILTAKTLPTINASSKILKRLGFVNVRDVVDEDAGIVWQ